MPIGPDVRPPGVDPRGKPSIVDRTVMYLASLVGGAVRAIFAIADPTTTALQQASLRRWPVTAIDPALAADAVQRGVLPGADWQGEAQLAGLDKSRFDALVELSGNPPGPSELLGMWRLGRIDKNRLEHGIRQGRIKNEWTDFYEAQRYLPISVAEAVQAAVQGHLSVDQARDVADRYGITADDFDVLYETAGNPPGVMEMLTLWRRGFVPESDVDQAIRESRVKNKYLPALKRLLDYFPPPRTVTTLLTHGAIDQATAMDLFHKAGLSPDLAAAYVRSAQHQKTATHKELTAGQITALYSDRALSRDAAMADLAKLGYQSTEAGLVLDLADARARQKRQDQAVSRVRTLYLSRKVDDAGARSDLTKLNLTADTITELLDLWQLEASAPSKQLTEAQLQRAYQHGVITPQDFHDRLLALGYDEIDAGILITLAGPPPTSTGG